MLIRATTLRLARYSFEQPDLALGCSFELPLMVVYVSFLFCLCIREWGKVMLIRATTFRLAGYSFEQPDLALGCSFELPLIDCLFSCLF